MTGTSTSETSSTSRWWRPTTYPPSRARTTSPTTPRWTNLRATMTDQHVPTGPHELELEMLDLRPALEAVLMVADQPLDHLTLAQAVGHPPVDVEQALAELAEEYAEQGRGFELRNIAGGWRFFTREG